MDIFKICNFYVKNYLTDVLFYVALMLCYNKIAYSFIRMKLIEVCDVRTLSEQTCNPVRNLGDTVPSMFLHVSPSSGS
jgi:hypothetical protein